VHAEGSKAGLTGSSPVGSVVEWYSRRRCCDMKVVPSQEGAGRGSCRGSGMMKNGHSKGPVLFHMDLSAVERFRWRWECGRLSDKMPLPVPYAYALTFNLLIVLRSS
jgi:hypothetical protein